MKRAKAYAKINLGLVAGPLRPDGKHEIVTVLQRIDLHDDIALEQADRLSVEGFSEDTIVRRALESLSLAAGVERCWRVRIEKQIPVAAGLGGGSSDAAAALQLANSMLAEPLDAHVLHHLAADVGADVPFFLQDGTQLACGDGTELAPVGFPTNYHVLLVVPHNLKKASTADVFADFDARGGPDGFAERAATFHADVGSANTLQDVAGLAPNDLATSPLVHTLRDAGAFRADVSGAGPAVYGLFEHVDEARRVAGTLAGDGESFVTRPVPAVDLP